MGFFVIIFVCIKDIFFYVKTVNVLFWSWLFHALCNAVGGCFHRYLIDKFCRERHEVPICEKCFFFFYVVDLKLELVPLLRGVFVTSGCSVIDME